MLIIESEFIVMIDESLTFRGYVIPFISLRTINNNIFPADSFTPLRGGLARLIIL